MEPAALTPREILGLLAEEDRLRVVSALVLGATTSAEVAAATGMTVRETGRALARLAAGGLVESGPDGYRRRADGTDPATSRSVKHYWRAGGFFDVDEDGADRG